MKIISGLCFLLLVSTVNAQVDFQRLLTITQSKTASYQAPSFNKIQHCQQLFYQALSTGYTKNLQQAWLQQGFSLTQQDGVLVIKALKNQGEGVYVIKEKKQVPLIALQAPHSFKDLHTGKIIAELLQHPQFYAGGWNSVPRYGAYSQDLAHLDNSIFQAFTQALAQAHPDSWIVQLHGFNQKKRKTATGQRAEMILSNTESDSPVWLQTLAQHLRQQWRHKHIEIYPQTIRELGGTKNRNAFLLKRQGFTHFIHIETSKKMRDELRHHPQSRQVFIQALQQLP